ncbi:malate dehydrogenase [endosymbiont of Ridgeia piscesae]|jgi:malate dehydrogenase|uniref:Malate dehydrogenase n=1 Tax=endosymbiont of Ridgeia piscesae TaxID=54398 RepID=A0A0T5YU34_9GAMM|nr:malate dehydrogenase [endosymbiont of Ridgeia piscesae]KRT54087.1 malate dehydrogenase (NAD) [endosymbiont of Ridgeia piscesae]KRT57876.1 malate dehydrogenase (NAD) [endosymbiont of Ridgeia piscesae]
MSRKKIALIGGGQIGGTLAMIATQKELGDVVIIDLPHLQNPMKGKALDLMGMRPVDGVDVELSGSGEMAAIAGADVIIVTAGVPRKPGMSRDDLLDINLSVTKKVATAVKQHAPDAFVILTTNPLDSIVYAFHKLSGLPAGRIIGMAGALDTARFRTYIAMETGLSVKDVSCLVMGGHGPTMIPVTRTASVGGIPLTELLDQETIQRIVERTRNAGTEIVGLLGNGSAFYSSAAAAIEMAESYLKDKKRVIASAVLCRGEYGVDGYFMGVPCVIGSGGVEKVVEFTLTAEEQQMFETTLEAVKASVERTGL